jgi:hypothetical protein
VYSLSHSRALRKIDNIGDVFGTGVFHASVEAYGQEWSYGYGAVGTGIFTAPPKCFSGHTFRETHYMGDTVRPPGAFTRP